VNKIGSAHVAWGRLGFWDAVGIGGEGFVKHKEVLVKMDKRDGTPRVQKWSLKKKHSKARDAEKGTLVN